MFVKALKEWLKFALQCPLRRREFNVQSSVHHKYIPFDIFPKRCNITQFIYFWKTAQHVSGAISTHHQDHTQVFTISGTCQTVAATCRYCGRVGTGLTGQTSSNSSTIAVGSSNGLTSTRYCKYSCVCSWLWVKIPPEACRAVFQK